MLVFSEWLSANEGRAYPINDAAKRTGDGVLPTDILVDCQIWLPRSVGRYVSLSSVGLSPSLATLTFVAWSDNPLCGAPSATFTPIAVVSVPRPVQKFRNYAVTALQAGVGGWVAFGSGANNRAMNLLFESAVDGLLVDRVVRSYPTLPVTTLGKLGVYPPLQGAIRFRGVPGAVVVKTETRVIGGDTKQVVLIGLEVAVNAVTILRDFAGPCGNRPSAASCNRHPLVSINGVKPDCDGNIELVFEEEPVVGDTGDGLILDHPTGMPEICPPPNFTPTDENDCEPEI